MKLQPNEISGELRTKITLETGEVLSLPPKQLHVLSGVLTGANYGGEVKSLYSDHSEPQNVGHLFFAIRPDLCMAKEEFAERMDTFVSRAKASPLAQGFDEILIPGEPEARTAAERRQFGIPVTETVVESLLDEAKIMSIDVSSLLG